MTEAERERIAFACVHGDVRHSTFDDSKDLLLAYDRANDEYLSHDYGRMFVRAGTDGLVAARNLVVQRFLESEAQWLFWVDSDMGYAPDTLSQLRATAEPEARPIVGALCFASRQTSFDGLNGYRTRPLPTIYQWADVDGTPLFVSQPLYPVNGVLRVAGTGSACVLIHRTVFEKIERDWYTRIPGHDGKLLGEDISFCVRAGAAGFPIYVNTAVKTSHVKPQWVSEADHWRSYVAPPAADEASVVMVEGSEATLEFLHSLHASTGLALWYPDGNDDTPWIVYARSEHRFRAGWLDHAQLVAAEFHADVVALNDLSPEALAGQGSSVYMVSREFLGEGSLSDAICRAIRRGTFAMAMGSVVELTHD